VVFNMKTTRTLNSSSHPSLQNFL